MMEGSEDSELSQEHDRSGEGVPGGAHGHGRLQGPGGDPKGWPEALGETAAHMGLPGGEGPSGQGWLAQQREPEGEAGLRPGEAGAREPSPAESHRTPGSSKADMIGGPPTLSALVACLLTPEVEG